MAKDVSSNKNMTFYKENCSKGSKENFARKDKVLKFVHYDSPLFPGSLLSKLLTLFLFRKNSMLHTICNLGGHTCTILHLKPKSQPKSSSPFLT